MAKRHRALRRRQGNPSGWPLTLAVVALAVAVCALASPPKAEDVAAVFAPGAQSAAPSVDALTLPARDWYLVIANGQAVAACGALLEAEILRGSYGAPADIRMLSTDEIALRITASAAQLSALRRSADALFDTFDTLNRMIHQTPEEAVRTATQAAVGLDKLAVELDTVLKGTENPVVRGLAGLAGSCREAMVDLSINAEPMRVHGKNAALAQQYEAYVNYLSGGDGSRDTSRITLPTAPAPEVPES